METIETSILVKPKEHSKLTNKKWIPSTKSLKSKGILNIRKSNDDLLINALKKLNRSYNRNLKKKELKLSSLFFSKNIATSQFNLKD